MIGKPEWFRYRVFGWGVSPKTWQGWLYVLGVALLMGVVTMVNLAGSYKPWLFAAALGIVMLDVFHIMLQMPKVSDERENLHQLIIERNCSFAAIFSLAGIAVYQSYEKSLVQHAAGLPFDMSIIIVLGAMLLTKVVSTLYVNSKL